MYQNGGKSKSWPVFTGLQLILYLPCWLISSATQNGKSNIIPIRATTILFSSRHLQDDNKMSGAVFINEGKWNNSNATYFRDLQRYCWRRLVDVFFSLQLIPRWTSPNIYLDLQSLNRGLCCWNWKRKDWNWVQTCIHSVLESHIEPFHSPSGSLRFLADLGKLFIHFC